MWLRAALTEAAQAASCTKNMYLAGQYHLLVHDCEYVDLGSRYLEERERQQIERRVVRRLEDFGYTVNLEPTTTAA